jgi:hypothetical protein
MPRRAVKADPAVTRTTKITVDGVDLTVTQILAHKRVYINVKRVVGRDRKRKIDITAGIETEMEDALHLVRVLKSVVAFQTARCTCDYRYGFSDHAEHCQSIYVARGDDACCDDD